MLVGDKFLRVAVPRDFFVRKEMIDRLRIPYITVRKIGPGEIAAAGLVELDDDLIAIVDESTVFKNIVVAVPHDFAQPAVVYVVGVRDNLRDVAVVVLERDGSQPVAVVPSVNG